MTYAIKLQEKYNINEINAEIVFYYQELDDVGNVVIKQASVPSTLAVNGNAKSVSGSIDITDYNVVNIDQAKVYVRSVTGSDGTLNIS